MDESWSSWIEQGRALLAAPPLTRGEKKAKGQDDPKWALGDLLLELPEQRLDRFAEELDQSPSEFRRLRDVAGQWPPEHRVAASWSAHRDLKDHQDRFNLIHPGMTVRQAAKAAGKADIDAKPTGRMTLEERADHVAVMLADKATNAAVLERLEERRATRRMRQATRMAADERSAEYKEAMRALRQAQASKSPEVAFLEVVFKLQEATEYLRAVYMAATDTTAAVPLVPQNRKPELLMAIEGIAEVARQALQALDGGASRPVDEDVYDVEAEDVRRSRPKLLE